MTTSTERSWRIRSLQRGFTWEGPLFVEWEVNLSSISDDYLPTETSAVELLHVWADCARQQYPDELIPIYWYVRNGKLESMPFDPKNKDRHFLNFFTWPEDARTGERMNWLALPVVDKAWRVGRGDKGGFIQEATGWKPGILQPTVYLPALLSAAEPR